MQSSNNANDEISALTIAFENMLTKKWDQEAANQKYQEFTNI